MYGTDGKRLTSQVTSGRDYTQQEAHPDLITGIPQDIRAFDEYEPPAVGTRFDVGTTAIEYVGEYYFDYQFPSEDAEHEFYLLSSETHQPFSLVLSDFQTYYTLPGFHGIWHGTVNSGYLLRMINDGEGAFLFRHWGLS